MAAVLGCLLLACLYVGLLSLWQPRDQPRMVWLRMGSCVAVCFVSWIPLYAMVKQKQEDASLSTVLSLLGLGAATGWCGSLVFPLVLLATAYAGPIMFWILEGNEGAPNPGRLALPVRLRNLLIAPITEEWVFRGCMVGMLKLEGWEDGQTTFAAPLFFGVAHIHHIYQLVLHQSYTVVEAVLEVLFQVLYTTAFGWYAVFVLLHTKSLPACVLCHCACNLLGLPILPEMIQHERKRFWLVTTAIGIISFFSSLSPLGELCKVTKDIW